MQFKHYANEGGVFGHHAASLGPAELDENPQNRPTEKMCREEICHAALPKSTLAVAL
jgi:hypothetical protein